MLLNESPLRLSLRRLPIAFGGLFDPAAELKKQLAFVVDNEREHTERSDYQSKNECAHALAPPAEWNYNPIVLHNRTAKDLGPGVGPASRAARAARDMRAI